MKRWFQPEILAPIIRRRWLLHLLFWGTLFCLLVIPDAGRISLQMRAAYYGIRLLSIAAVCYIHFFLWNRCLSRRRYWIYAGSLALVIAAAAYGETRVISAYLGHWGNAAASAASIIFFIAFTSAIRLAKMGISQRIEFEEIKAKQLQTELALLRAQINPHFLFNTLNNLYAMAQREADASTADAIARLSHLMRYVIYDSNVARIELSREVEQVRSYIELQRLRVSEEDDVDISFAVAGETDGLLIAPMLLMPFVENAFKHGISLRQPSHVLINLAVAEGTLHFTAENTVRKRAAEKSEEDSALGLKNVRRRLELLYPDRHDLTIDETEEHFKIALSLTLQ